MPSPPVRLAKPRYIQIADELVAQIALGRYAVGEALPTESALCSRFRVSRHTAREALRNKVLYSILAFAALVVGVAALFGSASIGNQMKFVKDFSLAAISLFGVVIAVTLGVSMLSKELGRRTILNILSKPVARWQFIVGKFAGLALTLVIVVALMTSALIGIVAAFEGSPDPGLVVAGAAIVSLSPAGGRGFFQETDFGKKRLDNQDPDFIAFRMRGWVLE